jgi:O-antigen ligase
VTVLAFAAAWLIREHRPGVRALLGGAAAASILTIYLLYERTALVIAIAIAAVVLSKLRTRLRWRVGGAVALAIALVLVAVTGPGAAEQLDLLRISGHTRVTSLGSGVLAIVHHPLTGLGLGWSFRSPGHPAAHSAVLQAGVEMGIFAMAGVAILTIWFLLAGIRALRASSIAGPILGANVASSVYALYTFLAGGVNAGIGNGLVSVWALAIAVLTAIALSDRHPPVASRWFSPPRGGESAMPTKGSTARPQRVGRSRG